jgi:bifunctional non-homologous end joining protein LigD
VLAVSRPDSDKTGFAAEALAEYRRRRDFTRTAEPAGAVPATGDPGASAAETVTAAASAPGGEHPARLAFVVQKHAASSLHYDFRLELGGVLKSWAVPKGPSLDPADKRLAVRTEDHPLEYATFEGTIPENQYGGGTVLLWDFGWWEPDITWMKAAKGGGPTDPAAALAAGDLKFVIHGQKLTGSWALVQMKGRGEKNWLLLKHRDEAARPGVSVINEAPDSVASGRSLDQIAADEAG